VLNHLDNLLRDLFMNGVAGLTDEAQVRFQPPDEQWRAYVKGLAVDGDPVDALNVYLFDLRENRKLRSNDRARTIENGIVSEEPAPARLDCHYLISAWSPAAVTPTVEATLDEHALLYQAAAVLVRNGSLNPSRVYPAGSAPLLAWPEPFRDVDLPAVISPVEGFNKLAEFWSGMGQGARWKPVIYLIVTVPIALLTEIAGPMVTTRITEYRQTGRPETAEVWIQLGGHVLDATVNPPVPLAQVWVQLETLSGERLQTAETDTRGRFTFVRVQPGRYRLRWRSGPRPEPPPRVVDVPSPSGEYDLRFQ
jgi:hypothetical protein